RQPLAARISDLALPRSQPAALQRRVPLDRRSVRRHGAVRRRRQGRRALPGPRSAGPEENLRHRPDAAHAEPDSDPDRAGPDGRGHGPLVLVQPELLNRFFNTGMTRSFMSTRKRTRFATIIGGTLCVAAALTMASSAASPRFYGDDPVWREADTQDASAMKPLEVDLLADLATNLLGSRTVTAGRAKNLNTVDEVPDSSWYTNRAAARPLTPA